MTNFNVSQFVICTQDNLIAQVSEILSDGRIKIHWQDNYPDIVKEQITVDKYRIVDEKELLDFNKENYKSVFWNYMVLELGKEQAEIELSYMFE